MTILDNQALKIQKNFHIPIEKSGLDRYEKILTFANTMPIFLSRQDSIMTAVYKMIQSRHRSLPVILKDKRLEGMVATSDIFDAFLNDVSFSDSVGTVMTEDVVSVNHDVPLGMVVKEMKATRRGRLPVLKDKKIAGMISEYDIAKYFAHANLGIQVSEVMAKKPLFLNHDISILDSLKILASTKYRRLPVVQSGKAVGIVAASDMLKYLRNTHFMMPDLVKPVSSVMKRKIISISKHKDISEAIRSMLVHDVSGVLVIDSDRLEGIITYRDVIDHLV